MSTTFHAARAAAPRPTLACPPALAEAIPLLPAPAAVFDGAGAALLANAPFTRMLDDEPHSAALQDDIARFIRSLRHEPANGAQEVEALGGRYQLQARWITRGGHGFALVVAARRDAPAALCDAALRTRFGLTRTEVRVARLMAEGHSNRGVAEALCISPHTARHHAEHIMAKMSAATRAEVGARLRAAKTHEGSG